jgi:hypothetical protein
MMHLLLAHGGRADLAGSSLVLALECALVLSVDAILMAMPVVAARRRGIAGAESILAGAVLWAVLAALYAGNFVVTEFQWSRERTALIMSGYDDPTTSGDGPRHPWGWWVALAGGYVVLVTVALLGKRRGPAGATPQG